MPGENSSIQVEITDAREFHCFRLVFNPPEARSGCCDAAIEEWGTGDCYCAACHSHLGQRPQRLEIMLHARSLVDLIHKLSLALCDWQQQTSSYLIDRLKGGDGPVLSATEDHPAVERRGGRLVVPPMDRYGLAQDQGKAPKE